MKAARRKPRRARHLPELFLSGLLVAVGFVPSACLLPEVELVDQLGSGGSAGAKPASGGRASMGGVTAMGGKSGSVGGWGGRDGSFGGRDGMTSPGASISDQCNWSSGSCDDLSCESACPTNAGDYCRSSCEALVDCVSRNPDCQTLTDPVCGLRSATGRPNACTADWEGATGDAITSPGKIALAYITCVCEL
jgi:hypothetical protein